MILQGAIQFDRVTFSYGTERRLVHSLELTVPQNSITAILDPNGTGKTTLLHLALGWLLPLEGRVLLFGRDLRECPGQVRGRSIGLLPQKEPVNFEYTVLEYLLLGRAPYLKPLEVPGPSDITIVTNAISAAGIAHMARRRIPTLSGGEGQLVLLSRTMSQDPTVFLLDEPTNHLDLKNRSRMVSLLRELRDKGKTIVFTTHDPELASLLARYLILLGPDGAVRKGPCDELFTEDNLSAVYGLPVRIAEVGGHPRVLWEAEGRVC